MDSKPHQCLHAIVNGRVQGVGFRMFVQQTAIALNITGWVRNRWDGSVEIIAEGEKERLDQLLSAIWAGPRAARVIEVHEIWQSSSEEYSGFSMRSTI